MITLNDNYDHSMELKRINETRLYFQNRGEILHYDAQKLEELYKNEFINDIYIYIYIYPLSR